MSTQFHAVGRRKKAVARVWIKDGKGKLVINKRDGDQYFADQKHINSILAPFDITETAGRFDINATVSSGGLTGQAEAIRLGVARALVELDEGHKKALRIAGYLTRDSRRKERKKYGRRGARASFQFSKR